MEETKPIFILALSILLFSYTLNAEEKNYCHDKDANLEWEALVQKYPEDLQLQTLHALRLGLCLKVERGDMTVDEASEMFEHVRMVLVETRMEEMLIGTIGNAFS